MIKTVDKDYLATFGALNIHVETYLAHRNKTSIVIKNHENTDRSIQAYILKITFKLCDYINERL